jgi:hypothetical protein
MYLYHNSSLASINNLHVYIKKKNLIYIFFIQEFSQLGGSLGIVWETLAKAGKFTYMFMFWMIDASIFTMLLYNTFIF